MSGKEENLYQRDNEEDIAGIIYEEMLELWEKHGILITYELKPGSKIKGAFLKTDKLPEVLNKFTLKEYRPLTRPERKDWEARRKGKPKKKKGVRKKSGFLKRQGRVW